MNFNRVDLLELIEELGTDTDMIDNMAVIQPKDADAVWIFTVSKGGNAQGRIQINTETMQASVQYLTQEAYLDDDTTLTVVMTTIKLAKELLQWVKDQRK